jgi:hypothetical protein
MTPTRHNAPIGMKAPSALRRLADWPEALHLSDSGGDADERAAAA